MVIRFILLKKIKPKMTSIKVNPCFTVNCVIARDTRRFNHKIPYTF